MLRIDRGEISPRELAGLMTDDELQVFGMMLEVEMTKRGITIEDPIGADDGKTQ